MSRSTARKRGSATARLGAAAFLLASALAADLAAGERGGAQAGRRVGPPPRSGAAESARATRGTQPQHPGASRAPRRRAAPRPPATGSQHRLDAYRTYHRAVNPPFVAHPPFLHGPIYGGPLYVPGEPTIYGGPGGEAEPFDDAYYGSGPAGAYPGSFDPAAYPQPAPVYVIVDSQSGSVARGSAPSAAERLPHPTSPAPPPQSGEPGRIELLIEPADALVYLDDRLLGTAAEVREMGKVAARPGVHVLEVVHPTLPAKRLVFGLDAGGGTRVEADLRSDARSLPRLGVGR